MGRYYFNSRWSTDDYTKRLTIATLKKDWFLDGSKNWYSATLSWSNGSNIWIQVNMSEDTGIVRVYFTQTSRDGEKKELDYRIQIVSTPCNYGGKRWWLVCPLKWNKCTILYLQNNGWFGSRKTLNLCYDDQRQSKRSRNLSFMMGMNAARAIALHRTMKYPYRNGKPTKKMVRFLKLSYNNPRKEDVEDLFDNFFHKKVRK